MFIDYIALMLINTVAGLVLLADFVYRGLDGANLKRWIPGFGLVGAIALATGLPMTWTWPLPGSFNISFGGTTVLFGGLYLATAITLAQSWDLLSLTLLCFFCWPYLSVGGPADYGLRANSPTPGRRLSLYPDGPRRAAGRSYPGLSAPPQRLAYPGGGVPAGCSLIWAVIGYRALWSPMDSFSDWQPPPWEDPSPLGLPN